VPKSSFPPCFLGSVHIPHGVGLIIRSCHTVLFAESLLAYSSPPSVGRRLRLARCRLALASWQHSPPEWQWETRVSRKGIRQNLTYDCASPPALSLFSLVPALLVFPPHLPLRSELCQRAVSRQSVGPSSDRRLMGLPYLTVSVAANARSRPN